MKRTSAVFSLVFGLLCCTTVSADTTLVDAGAKTVWSYFDRGSELPAQWRQAGFEDASWKTGASPLGYGEPEIATQVSFGEDAAAKHITTYFRKHFQVANRNEVRELLLLLRVDDGAVVYLNGTEIVRENIAAGETSAQTAAQRRIDGADEGVYHRYLVHADALVTGRNELAVEVHQFSATSSDLFFDLLLKGYGPKEVLQRARVAAAARDVTLAYREKHYVGGGVAIPDGYVDGGRRMQVDAAGNVQTDREVLLVDRARDPQLRQHLAFARSDFIASLPAMARARFLALYVDIQCSPPSGRGSTEAAAGLVEGEFRDREMLLGRSVGSGVCRHRALLFKILADEAGLDVALVRGNLGRNPDDTGGHTWNELRLKDGTKKWIVDCMNPSGGFDFPSVADPAAQQYWTVDDKPYYSNE